MRKRGRIALVALLAIVLAGLSWQFLFPAEPVYQGKLLRQYLDQLASHYPPKSADDPNVKALHAMGPKAILICGVLSAERIPPT